MVPRKKIIPTTVFLVFVMVLLHCFNDSPEIPENPEVWMVVNDSLMIDSLGVVRIATDDTMRIMLKTFLDSLIDSISLTANDSALDIIRADTSHALFWAGDTGRYTVNAGAWKSGAIAHRCSLTVEIVGKGVRIVHHPQPDSVREDAPLHLWVAATGTRPLHFAWYRDSTLIDSTSGDTLTIDSVKPSDAGYYYCIVSNEFGSPDSSDSALIIVLPVNDSFITITYDGNGHTAGIVPVDSTRYEKGSVAKILGNPGAITKRGYSFAGWNVRSDGSGKNRDSTDIIAIDTESVTLYAKWNPNDSFTVTYEGNGATSGEVPDTVRYYKTGELVTVSGNSGNFKKSGFTFVGWNTKADGSGTEYKADTPFEIGDSSVTLHAQWSDNPTFTVTYDKNGADGGDAPVNNSCRTGEIVTVPGCSTLAKSGNTFVGWNTTADGKDGSAYNPGLQFTMGEKDITLFAQWTTKPAYTLTYLGNGATGTPPQPVTTEAGVKVKVATRGALVKKGHSFTVWTTNIDSSGTAYAPDSFYTMGAADDTLYAQWRLNFYTVTYDGNCTDVKKVPQQTTHRYNVKIALAVDTPVCTGHTFFRWNSAATGNGEDYQPGDTITTPDANVKLFARWNVNEYSVTYDGNGKTGGSVPEPKTVNFHDSVTIARGGDLALTGYTFTGWNTKADGSGTDYAADRRILMEAGGLKLFAKWKINQYTVTCDARGGTPATTAITVNYGSTVTPPTTIVKTGHSVAGWYRDSAYTVVWTSASDKVTGSMTLYAKWVVNPYKVTFDARGGTPAKTEVTVNYGSLATAPAAPTKTGYTFATWHRDSVCVTAAWNFTSDKVAGDVSLYAKWGKNSYDVIYNGNGSTAGSVPAKANSLYGDSVTVAPKGNLVRTGYTFIEWNTAANGSGTKYAPGAKFKMGAGVVNLYAQWRPDGMVRIPAKDSTFIMGDTFSPPEKPLHLVKFTEDFWMDTSETTQHYYDSLMYLVYGNLYQRPSWSSENGLGNDLPAYNVNWYDAVLFCNARTKASGSKDTVYTFNGTDEDYGNYGSGCVLLNLAIELKRGGFRLPTEAQWEYSCRGTSKTSFFWGKNYMPYPLTLSDSNEIDSYVIWKRNSSDKGSSSLDYGVHIVASKMKNVFGLYDMSGNVWEWCNDWFDEEYFTVTPTQDPTGPNNGSTRVTRGGCWDWDVSGLRSGARGNFAPFNRSNRDGFRTCLPPR